MSDTGLESGRTSQFEDVHFARINALFDVNRYQEAEKLIREQLSNEPEDAYWLFQLARAQIGQDNLTAAEETLFNSLSCDPEYAWSYYLLSTVSHQLHNFTQELKCAKKAAEMNPEEASFLQRLAEAHIQNGEVKSARLTLEQVVKLEPDSEESFRLLGDIEFELNNFPAAEEAYRQALKFNPEDISLLNDLARSLMSQKKKLRESIDVLYNIVQLDPTNRIISKNLYVAIREWIDKNSFKGKGKKALDELPENLQYFFKDYKERSSIFEAWGKFAWSFVWIGALIGVTYLFSLVDK